MNKKRPGEVFESWIRWQMNRPFKHQWSRESWDSSDMKDAFERGRKYERTGK